MQINTRERDRKQITKTHMSLRSHENVKVGLGLILPKYKKEKKKKLQISRVKFIYFCNFENPM